MVAVVLLLLVGSWTAQASLRTLAESSRWEQQTRDVLRQLTLVLSTMQDAETGQRGFVLTVDPAFLAPYDNALREIDSSLVVLRQLIRDNPGQMGNLERLEAMIAAKLEVIASAIALVRDGRRQQAILLIAEGGGLRTMNDIRGLLGQMEQQE